MKVARWRFAPSAGEAYQLAQQILRTADLIERGIVQLRAALALPPVDADQALTAELERLIAAKDAFEALVVKDPARAVHEFQRTQRFALNVADAGRGRHALRDVELARAVEHVREWLIRGKPPSAGFPVAALSPIATARPVRDRRDLERLSKHATVLARLRGAGPKAAAVTIVALASGVGESTVKRAVGSLIVPK